MATSLKERAYVYIRDQLLVGAMPMGDRVSDADIARELGISRTPVREAIAQLETQGLIQQEPGVGPRVKRLDRRELEESFELREILECSAAAMAAQRITDVELAALTELCDQYEAVAERVRAAGGTTVPPVLSGQLNVLDMAFHLTNIECAKNRQLLRAVRDVHLLTRILQRRADLPGTPHLERLGHICADHRQIVAALAQHDPALAQESVRKHVQWSRDAHLYAYDWEQRQQRTAASRSEDLFFPLNVLQRLCAMEAGDAAERKHAEEDATEQPANEEDDRADDGRT